MRLFAALLPPQDVIEDLDEFLHSRRASGDFAWTLTEQYHLTLAFCGNVREHSLDELTERLATTAAKRAPLSLSVGGGGAFPDVARAKVLWSGVESADDLAAAARGARNAFAAAGAPPDGRAFTPHLTLARMRPTNVLKWVQLLDTYRSRAWVADEVALVSSHPREGRRGRPRYEIESTFSMSAATEGDRA